MPSNRRCLLFQDGRLALVDGYPQQLIGFWHLSRIEHVAFIANKVQFFAQDCCGTDHGTYSFVCGPIQTLQKHFRMAQQPGQLTTFLKQKLGDGHWYEERSSVNASYTGNTRPSNRRCVESSEADLPAAINKTTSVNRSSSRKSKTSADTRSVTSCCTRSYVNEVGDECIHSHSDPSVSSIDAWDKPYDLDDSQNMSTLAPVDNMDDITSNAIRCSLSRADSWPKPLVNDAQRRRGILLRTHKWSVTNASVRRGRFVKQERKAFKLRYFDSFASQSRTGHVPRRSLSLGMDSRCLSSSREENWNRAKRIIGGVRKSINDLNNCKLSTSLDKLASSPIAHMETPVLASNEDIATLAEKPIILDTSLDSSTLQCFSPSTSTQSVNRLPGLIKLPQKKFGLKRARHILTKSLQKSISGSFAKYDGERSANHFNLEDAKPVAGPVVDCIESAVNKGRARLIEAERRSSGFVRRPSLVKVPAQAGVASSSATCERQHARYLNVNKNAQKLRTLGDVQCSRGDANLRQLGVDLRSPSTSSSRNFDQLGGKNDGTQRCTPLNGAIGSSSDHTIASKQSSSGKLSVGSLSGSYCKLIKCEGGSHAPSRKPSCTARTEYAQIDPVATIGATQTQQTMMKDRERVGLSKRYSSQNSMVRSESRSTVETNTPNGNARGFFARHLRMKLPTSISHSDLRF